MIWIILQVGSIDDTVKYLGIKVSNNISWSKHISNVCNAALTVANMVANMKI